MVFRLIIVDVLEEAVLLFSLVTFTGTFQNINS